MDILAIIHGYPVDYFFFEFLIWTGILGIPIFLFFAWKRKKFLKSKIWDSSIASFLWMILVYGSFIEPQLLQVKESSVHIPNLPRLKIAVVSDIHVGPYKKDEWIQKIVDKVNAIPELDAVMLPGDFVYGGAERYGKYLFPLQNIQIKNKWAVLGNHDHDAREPENSRQSQKVSSDLKSFGIQELKNKNFFWEDKGIWIVGIDDNYFGYHDLKKAFDGVDADLPQILLAHSPDIMDELGGNYNPSLVLSGHTHAGQIQIPFLGALPWIIPTRNGKNLEVYLYEKKNISLFISPGVGEVGPRARLFNPPQIIVLNINR